MIMYWKFRSILTCLQTRIVMAYAECDGGVKGIQFAVSHD